MENLTEGGSRNARRGRHRETGAHGLTRQPTENLTEKDAEKMTVTTYTVNAGTPAEYHGLKNAENNTPLYYAPNNWKTEAGAKRWAEKHGYKIA